MASSIRAVARRAFGKAAQEQSEPENNIAKAVSRLASFSRKRNSRFSSLSLMPRSSSFLRGFASSAYVPPSKNALDHGEMDGSDDPSISWEDGSREWVKEGVRHREGDKPAVMFSNGGQEFWIEGKRHRDGDKPAVIRPCGRVEWWKEGKRHRDGDKPAWILPEGEVAWMMHGKTHREGSKPAVILSDGTQEWWVDGELLRNGD